MRLFGLCLIALLPAAALAQDVHVKVDPHGPGSTESTTDFKTIQQALDHAPQAAAPNRTVIEIVPGTYHERINVTRNRPRITLLGLGKSPEDVVVTYSMNAKQAGGTFFTATAEIDADDFAADSITFENSAGPTGQAVAAAVRSDRAIFKRCRFLGDQDTLFADYGRQYYVDSFIAGGTDFIFGNATAVFYHNTISEIRNAQITAQSRTSPDQTTGYVIDHSRITHDPVAPPPGKTAGTGFGLGRPWRAYARVVVMNTELPADLNPAGWSAWNSHDDTTPTAYYAEFQNSGPGAKASERVSWSHQLTEKEAGAFTPTIFLRGSDKWNPVAEAAKSLTPKPFAIALLIRRPELNLKNSLLVIALSFTGPVFAQTPALGSKHPAAVHLGTTHGIDITSIDRAVKPGNNFYLFANGKWIGRTTIPADRASIGRFNELADRSDKQVLSIAEDAVKSSAPNTDTRRIADLFNSYMNQVAIERAGITPLKPELDRIAAIHDKHQLSAALGAMLRADTDALNNTHFDTPNLFGLWVAPGFQNSDHYGPYLMQGGIELPDRDYYLDSSAHMRQVRTKYIAHMTTMFKFAGLDHPDQRAQHVLTLETAIAKVQLTLADCEDIHHANNLWHASDFTGKAPGLDWSAFFRAASLGSQSSLYVWQPSAIIAESALVASTPLDTWKDWLTLHAIDDNAQYMSKALNDAWFSFFGTELGGAQEQRPRNMRAVRVLNDNLGQAVGKIYAARFFSPEARAKAQRLVANLLDVYHQRLEAITWMAPSTKSEALAKLGKLQVSVGYPDTFRTYSGLDIHPDDLFGNIRRAQLFEYHYQLSRIGKPVNRSEWCMDPQTVNAVNLPLDNGLNFPAAILQPPFFDPAAPDAANYGSIGTVIGHEISHTFDSEGADFDAKGAVRNWWTPADYTHFKTVTAALAAQFDTYEPLPGLHVNGKQTLGEDIADLGGVNAALQAYHVALAGKPAPKVGGFGGPQQAGSLRSSFTGDQQFFIAFAQVWANKTRDASLRRQLLTDPHAPAQIRPLTVRNLDEWYTNFNINPGDKLYLPPDQRIHIW